MVVGSSGMSLCVSGHAYGTSWNLDSEWEQAEPWARLGHCLLLYKSWNAEAIRLGSAAAQAALLSEPAGGTGVPGLRCFPLCMHVMTLIQLAYI